MTHILESCDRLLYPGAVAMPKDLIEALNTYRLEHKLSQVQLAKRLGVSFQTVNRWLNRHVKPSQIQEYHIRKLLKHERGSRDGQRESSSTKQRIFAV